MAELSQDYVLEVRLPPEWLYQRLYQRLYHGSGSPTALTGVRVYVLEVLLPPVLHGVLEDAHHGVMVQSEWQHAHPGVMVQSEWEHAHHGVMVKSEWPSPAACAPRAA